MTVEELIDRAKAFNITVEQQGPLYHVVWNKGQSHTSVPAGMLGRILTSAAKEQAKKQPELAALLPF